MCILRKKEWMVETVPLKTAQELVAQYHYSGGGSNTATYADEMQGHTGAIYRATNWEYCGMTQKEACFFKNGCMVARKAGPKTRTHQEMFDMGCEMVGRFAKHKFKHITSRLS